MDLDGRWTASRITLESQLIALALILLTKIRAWDDIDTSNPVTYVFVAGIATLLVLLLALERYILDRTRATLDRLARPRVCHRVARRGSTPAAYRRAGHPRPPQPIRSANSRDQPDRSDQRDARCCTDIVRRPRSPCAASRTRAAIALPQSGPDTRPTPPDDGVTMRSPASTSSSLAVGRTHQESPRSQLHSVSLQSSRATRARRLPWTTTRSLSRRPIDARFPLRLRASARSMPPRSPVVRCGRAGDRHASACI